MTRAPGFESHIRKELAAQEHDCKGSSGPAPFLLHVKYYYLHFSDEATEVQEPPVRGPTSKVISFGASQIPTAWVSHLHEPSAAPLWASAWRGRWDPESFSVAFSTGPKLLSWPWLTLAAILIIILVMLFNARRPLGTNLSSAWIHRHYCD